MTPAQPVTLVLSALAAALFALAALTDIRWRRIPNALCGALAVLGLVRIGLALAAGGPPLAAGLDIAAAAALFVCAAAGFHFGLIGGGDVKLLAAGTLWLGAGATGPFLLTTLLAGGLLAVLLVGGRMAVPVGARGGAGPSLPYGVAIAAGGILSTAGIVWA